MVDIGQFVGAGVGRVEDSGQQHDQLTAAVAGPVGHVVLDHPGQVHDRQAAFVECLGDGVDVIQVVTVSTVPEVVNGGGELVGEL
jgi:hypothetical protein